MGKNADRLQIEFKGELASIKDPEIRDLVIKSFDLLCPDQFWVQPASATGKYHPAVDCLEGGLVNHTHICVWWAGQLIRMVDEQSNNAGQFTDVIVAACLLHDMMKDGDITRSKEIERKQRGYICGCHGVDLAEAIVANLYRNDLANVPRKIGLVLEGVARHMGQWTQPIRFKLSACTADEEVRFVCWLVHMADYCASRKVDEQFEFYAKRKPIQI